MDALLAFLQSYHFKLSRKAHSNPNTGVALPSEEAAVFCESILEQRRLPFHPLCEKEGFEFFEKDICQSNVHRWLKLNDIMEWGLSDNIRIAVVSNDLSSLEKIGLLRIHPRNVRLSTTLEAHSIFRHAVSVDRAAADTWEHASACEHIFKTYFTRAFKILARVHDRETLLTFLGETFSSFRDGPIKMIFLEMVISMLSGWLGVGCGGSTSHSHSSLLSNGQSSSSNTMTAPISDRIREDGVSSTIRKALKEAEFCQQKLAVEACLHRYSITRFWPDILTRATSTSILVDLLLDRACAIYASPPLIGASGVDPAMGQIVTYHRREEVLTLLRCALKGLLSLQGVSFDNWARQVVWQRMRLPRSIRPVDWPEANPAGAAADGGSGDGEGVDLNATAIVFDFDSSVLMPGEQTDISLNSTFASPNRGFSSNDKARISEPEESDFVLAEFLIVGGDDEDLKSEVNRVLAEWCLLRPLAPAVLQSLSTQEICRRWRTLRLTLRCRKVPSEQECSASALFEYLRGLAVRARQK